MTWGCEGPDPKDYTWLIFVAFFAACAIIVWVKP